MKSIMSFVCLMALASLAQSAYVEMKPMETLKGLEKLQFPVLNVNEKTFVGSVVKTFEDLVRFLFNELMSGAMKPVEIVRGMFNIMIGEHTTFGEKVKALTDHFVVQAQNGAVYQVRLLMNIFEIFSESINRAIDMFLPYLPKHQITTTIHEGGEMPVRGTPAAPEFPRAPVNSQK